MDIWFEIHGNGPENHNITWYHEPFTKACLAANPNDTSFPSKIPAIISPPWYPWHKNKWLICIPISESLIIMRMKILVVKFQFGRKCLFSWCKLLAVQKSSDMLDSEFPAPSKSNDWYHPVLHCSGRVTTVQLLLPYRYGMVQHVLESVAETFHETYMKLGYVR